MVAAVSWQHKGLHRGLLTEYVYVIHNYRLIDATVIERYIPRLQRYAPHKLTAALVACTT